MALHAAHRTQDTKAARTRVRGRRFERRGGASEAASVPNKRCCCCCCDCLLALCQRNIMHCFRLLSCNLSPPRETHVFILGLVNFCKQVLEYPGRQAPLQHTAAHTRTQLAMKAANDRC